ncbi:hypothetical protein [Oerskovia sp. KBS0722]|uniref:hypothetical protein n=1 Tax=Oerskovia sp. KBS0722 TaxID=1179673 RepID=UPI00110EF597|nr:hypothetical protein [Oerskovia sp. KBS0722]QDW62915.1 hypothetical protein FFI11_010590 [Oerskovia sp. KBS0722]
MGNSMTSQERQGKTGPTKRSFFRRLLVAIIATGFLAGAGLVTAPAASAAPPGYYATCQSGTTQVDWTEGRPADCKTTYTVFKNWVPVLVMKAPPPRSSAFWTAVSQGYTATNRWCTNNTIVCQFVTGGFMAYGTYILTNSKA